MRGTWGLLVFAALAFALGAGCGDSGEGAQDRSDDSAMTDSAGDGSTDVSTGDGTTGDGVTTDDTTDESPTDGTTTDETTTDETTTDETTTDDGIITLSWDFRDGEEGWTPGYSNYTPGMEETIGFEAELAELPEELEREGTGWLLSGDNRSDDLFMFLKRELGGDDGIVAGTSYAVEYDLLVASSAPSGCFGIGGAPGESVWLKAGAAGVEPEAVEEDNYVVMTVDIGNQSQGGDNASIVDVIANGLDCEDVDLDNPPWVALERQHEHTTIIEAGADGSMWLLVGTDSGFEGFNSMRYLAIDVTLTPRE